MHAVSGGTLSLLREHFLAKRNMSRLNREWFHQQLLIDHGL